MKWVKHCFVWLTDNYLFLPMDEKKGGGTTISCTIQWVVNLCDASDGFSCTNHVFPVDLTTHRFVRTEFLVITPHLHSFKNCIGLHPRLSSLTLVIVLLYFAMRDIVALHLDFNSILHTIMAKKKGFAQCRIIIYSDFCLVRWNPY